MQPRAIVGLVFAACVAAVIALWIALHLGDGAPRTAPVAAAADVADVAAAAVDDAAPVEVANDAAPANDPATARVAVASSAAGDGTGVIRGVVVDRRQRPIASFALTSFAAFDAPERTREDAQRFRETFKQDAVHDDDGHFSLRVGPGLTTLVVEAPRYRRGGADRVRVVAGGATDVRVVLDDSNALRGTVRDVETGAPIAGASIKPSARLVDDEATSDATGRFEILSLPSERFSVEVSARGYQRLTLGGIRGDRSRDEVVDVELHPLVDGGPEAEYVGVGCVIDENRGDGGGAVIVSVQPGAPAAAVLHPGDVITSVDGNAVEHLDVWTVRNMIRGEAGTSVRLGIRRDGAALVVDVERARLPAPQEPPKLHGPRPR